MPTPPSLPAPGAALPPSCCVIPAGTVVVVELTEALSDRKAMSGDRFGLRLAEPIMIDGVVVVPAGVMGQGEVIDAKPPGFGGRPGRLVLAARYLESGQLRLGLQSFKLGGSGRDNSNVVVGVEMTIGIVGGLITGGELEYPVGARASAKVSTSVATAPITAPTAPSSTPTS
jgi:hypothetical protein